MKIKKHQEEMFLNDLRKAENAELAKGMADKLYDIEIK